MDIYRQKGEISLLVSEDRRIKKWQVKKNILKTIKHIQIWFHHCSLENFLFFKYCGNVYDCTNIYHEIRRNPINSTLNIDCPRCHFFWYGIKVDFLFKYLDKNLSLKYAHKNTFSHLWESNFFLYTLIYYNQSSTNIYNQRSVETLLNNFITA